MRLEAAVGGLILSTGVFCSSPFGHDIAHGLHRRNHDLHVMMKKSPTPTINLVKRGDVFNAPSGWPTLPIPAGFTLAGGVEITPIPQMALSAVSGSAALASAIAAATPAADPAAWNKEVDQKCQDAVDSLNGQSSSESGMAACYNVPFLDQAKGTFNSELRIYNVSKASGVFSGINDDQLMISMTYQSAAFQEFNGTLSYKRSLVVRQSSQGVTRPQLLSIKRYVGQINTSTFNSSMTTEQFKSLLTPKISIYAQSTTSSTNPITQLSVNDTSFVAGLFTSNSGNLTDPKNLLDNPAAKIVAAAQGLPTPFTVPGLSLGVFPTGLIITSVWMLVFAVTVIYGTLGRIKHRDQYRRDFRALQVKGIRRI